MDNFFLQDGNDEVEELEPIEELSSPESEPPRPPSTSPVLSDSGAWSVIRSYNQIPEPLALLDRSLIHI